MASILIMDDDQQFREMVAQTLSRGGHDVFEAADGVAGSQIAIRDHPDLVVVDILMPEKDGLEVIREIRKNSPDCKIVAVSGGGAQVHVDFLPAAQKLGAEAILYKPIEPDDLLKTVGNLLNS